MSGERTCSHCGTSLREGQDWCLQCGAGTPGSSRTAPSWRSAAIALGATGALMLGAAAAAYAALQEKSPATPPALAQTPTTTVTTTTTTPATTAPPTTTTPTPTPTGGKDGVPSSSLQTPNTPPKIPGLTPTPSTRGKSKTTASTKSDTTTSTTTTSSSGSSAAETKGSGQPVAVLLDTNAAQIYNPGNLPASRFGDPSLAIDGDTTTAWTVQLEGSEAPSVGAGLTLNLNSPLKIAQLTLITETIGITVQVYGTKSSSVPQSPHSEEWVPLSHAHLVKKRKATIKLAEDTKSFRQLLIWIIKAPTDNSGQFTASDVAIDEIQLYEPGAKSSQS